MINSASSYSDHRGAEGQNITSNNVNRPDGKITVVIRVVHTLTDASIITIKNIHDHVDEIIVLFSGTGDQLTTVRERLAIFSNVHTWWVYNFGYVEPILYEIINYIKNPWVIILTDHDVPSYEFLKWIDNFPTREADGYLCYRKFGSLNYKILPEWLVQYIKKDRKVSYQPYIFRREKIHISIIIHTPFRVKGNLIYLNPKKYYVSRSYSSEDLSDPEKFVKHWIEKEKKYIFIELFTKRMTRLSALNKIIEAVPILRNHLPVLYQRSFFIKEMTHFEYVIFELIRSISMKRVGLDVYQKIKLETMKNLKDHNSLELRLSELFRKLDGGIVNHMGLKSVLINELNRDFVDLVDPKEPEVTFIKNLLKSPLFPFAQENNFDIDRYIEEVKKELDANVKKYMPIK
jgi:hypothetical protein